MFLWRTTSYFLCNEKARMSVVELLGKSRRVSGNVFCGWETVFSAKAQAGLHHVSVLELKVALCQISIILAI